MGTKLITNNQTGTSFEQTTLPFGNVLASETSGVTNQPFTSYDRSQASGLDYANNRTYDAGQGRFTQVDPIGMSSTSLANPQSLNLYAYVQNDPVNLVDPSGLNASGCSAEFSYEQCGGDDQFWGSISGGGGGGGGFGDDYANHWYRFEGMSGELRQSILTYEERVNNAIYGNGFRTAFEIAVSLGLLAFVTVTGEPGNYHFDYDWNWRGGQLWELNGQIFKSYNDWYIHKFPRGDGVTMLDPLDHMALAGIASLFTGLVSGLLRSGTKEGTNLVYQGIDKAGVVRYVGITEREASVRFAEHLGANGTGKELLQYSVIDGATGLSRTSARVWEQTLINQYGLGKNGGQLLNKINSIAPKNWWEYGIK